jgi:hypothetical protein
MNNRTTLAVATLLLLLSPCFLPLPAQASNGTLTLSPSQGTVGTVVSIPSTCGYGSGTYQVIWDDDQIIGEGQVSQGCVSVTFIVPEAPRGKHKVRLKVADKVISGEFTVVASISLTPTKATVGSEVTISGKGFNANESGIQVLFDGNAVKTGITASGRGSWETTFKVPASVRGNHKVSAQGTTPASEVGELTFTVLPRITINPTSGSVGTVVSIVGTGFTSGDTNIRVTYDGMVTKSGIAADATGSWQSSFSVPASARGSHDIGAAGAVTPEEEIAKVSFTVSPVIKVEPASGYLGDAIYVGDSLWVNGIGFEANESGIRVTFDGTQVASNIVADAKGSWSTKIEVPQTVKGKHTIGASGNVNKPGEIPEVVVVVSPKVELNPATGAVGEEVMLVGSGFAASQALIISYDGTQVAANATTDTKGNFATRFKIPPSKAGDHTITVTDATASVSSVKFAVESTPPSTPRLLSPEAGTRLGVIGKTVVSFDWEEVTDPSGVFYTLEISPTSDFSGTVLRKDGLGASEYTLTEKEALPRGKYYWRVKAVDGAGNESAWSTAQMVEVSAMQWWLIAVIALGASLLIVIIWRIIHVVRSSGLED